MVLNLSSSVSGLWGGAVRLFISGFWYFLIIGVVAFEIRRRRYQKTYGKYKVRAFRRRENNKRPEDNYPAGYLKDKSGVTFFRVKLGKMPWEYRDFYDLPDAKYMDDDNRVCYEVVNPNVWVQVKKTFIPNQIKMVEVEFIKDYGVYKKGFKSHIQEDHVDFLLKENAVKVTGESYTIDATDVTYKPISSAEKKLVVQELWDAKQVIGASDWKTSLPWVAGTILLLGGGLLVYLLNTGQLT